MLPTCIEEMIKEYSGHRPLRHKPKYAFMPEEYLRGIMLMGYDITILNTPHDTYVRHHSKTYRVYKRDDTNVENPERFLGVLRTVHMDKGHVFSLFSHYTKKSHVRNLNEKPPWFPLEYRPRLEKLLKSAQSFVPHQNEVVVVPNFEAGKFVQKSLKAVCRFRYDSEGDPEEYWSYQ